MKPMTQKSLPTGGKGIKVKINQASYREDIVIALAGSGYKVWIEEKEDKSDEFKTDYYVCFEIN